MQHVLPIETVQQRLVHQAGQKCVHLSRLLAHGFQVPRGFCILSTGYERFVDTNELQEKIRSFLEQFAPGSPSPHDQTADALAAVFLSSRFPDDLKEEILSAYRALAENGSSFRSVAVRSSGALEDGVNASFAGQFESYLNVRGERALLEQIKRCWASFWNTHSLCYQRDRRVSNGSAGIAILVQAMVPARLSGVLFTANPMAGSARQMVIEGSWGLGKAIVGGTVKPDRYVVDFETGEVVEQIIQNKEVMVVLDRRKGRSTLQTKVPPARQSIPCLTAAEIGVLVETGKRVHQHFGGAQDIEWAFHGRKLYLLQTRPITTLRKRRYPPQKSSQQQRISWVSEFDTSAGPETEWTSSTIRDMLPGPLSPLTISQMSTLEYGFQKPQEELGLLPQPGFPPDRHFLGFFYSRAHLNMTLIHALIRQVPLVSPENLERLLEEEPDAGPKKSWLSLRFARDIPNLLRVGLHAIEMGRRVEPAAETLLADGLRQYEEEQAKDLASQTPEELLCWLDKIQKRQAEIYAMHITASQFGEVTFQLFKRLTRRLAGESQGKMAHHLITGSSAPLFSKRMAELWALAQRLSGSHKLRQCFAAPNIQTTWHRLRADKGTAAKSFRKSFESFLKQYGYFSRYGAELMRPPWAEEPVFILSLVKIYSKLLLTLNPWELGRGQDRRRFHTLRALESNLNPVSKKVLRELLKLMDVLIPLRQNMRALSLMQVHLARRATQQLAKCLFGAGVLDSESDIYFLTMDDVRETVRGSFSGQAAAGTRPELRGRIERRRAEYQRNIEVDLPERFRGRPEPVPSPTSTPVSKGDKRIHGIPVSPGKFTGPARRITAPGQEIRVQPGEILILPGMDPGWTLLFPAANAIVTESGGMLSHGSILARSYGIPAVTGMRDITRVIHTGQVITVDGDRGEVWL